MKTTRRVRSTIGSRQRGPVGVTPAQIVRQAGLILAVVAVWSGLLVVYLTLTGMDGGTISESPGLTPVVASPEATQAPATATATVLPTAPAPTTAAAATSVSTALPPAVATSPGPTEPPALPDAAILRFSADVLPILSSRCQRCHGGDRASDGLDLRSYAAVMQGSRNGPVVIPGSSATSLLIQVLLSGKMPQGAPRLPDSEIQTIADWVDQGAVDN